jgi:hypothetical protein
MAQAAGSRKHGPQPAHGASRWITGDRHLQPRQGRKNENPALSYAPAGATQFFITDPTACAVGSGAGNGRSLAPDGLRRGLNSCAAPRLGNRALSNSARAIAWSSIPMAAMKRWTAIRNSLAESACAIPADRCAGSPCSKAWMNWWPAFADSGAMRQLRMICRFWSSSFRRRIGE